MEVVCHQTALLSSSHIATWMLPSVSVSLDIGELCLTENRLIRSLHLLHERVEQLEFVESGLAPAIRAQYRHNFLAQWIYDLRRFTKSQKGSGDSFCGGVEGCKRSAFRIEVETCFPYQQASRTFGLPRNQSSSLY